MKISTKLFLGILFSIGSILILGFILFLTNQQINQASEKRNRAEEIVEAVFERNLLFNEFVRRGGERVTLQLQIKNTSIGEVLREANQQFVGRKEKNVLTAIEQNYDDTTLALGRLMKSYTLHGLARLDVIELELRERLINQILIESQATLNSVAELDELSRETVSVAQRQAQIAILVFIIFLVVMMGGGLILVNRSITKPMNYFLSVVQTIASGDLNKRALVTSKDEIGQLAVAFNNMTDKLEKSYESLEDAKAKDEAILESMGDGLIVTDQDRRITLVNKATERLLGWRAGELMGKQWFGVIKVVDEERRPVTFEVLPIHRALKDGTIATSNKYGYTRRDGVVIDVAITASPVHVQGELSGAVIVFRDITQEKEIDRAKSEFVMLASHQLRTPLSSLNWYAEMVLGGEVGPLTQDQKKYLEKISRNSRRMAALVNALLNVSRIEMGTLSVDPKPMQLQEIADDVLEEFAPLIKQKSLKFENNYDKDLPIINVDPGLTRTIFENLLSNAVKYTPEKGSVVLSITKRASDVLITVADTGYGIPKAQQSKIFTKLFRADNIKEIDTDGNGIGLYIVKAIVELAQGKIWFESEENKGSTFYVTLSLEGMKPKKGVEGLESS